MATATEKLTGADKRWGWVLGCDGYFTRDEAAKRLRVSNQTVDRLAKRGLIRYLKHGRSAQSKVTICCRSIEEYAKSQEL